VRLKKQRAIKIGFLKSWNSFSGKSFLILYLVTTSLFSLQAQNEKQVNVISSLPPGYFSLKTDEEKMIFLTKTIADSLNEAQLTYVLAWSQLGLQLAEKNDNDTLKGIFHYDIGKAFTYKYNKYDSAIFNYKQVLPYFSEKQNKYYVFSLREIMDRYADLGNKDSSFAYMDMLRAYIDTMSDSAPKKIALSQNIAVVYQGFGMYRTAIRYFYIAVNGSRQNKNHHPR